MSAALSLSEGSCSTLAVRRPLLVDGRAMDFAGPQPGDPDWQEWLDSTDAEERARVRELLQALREIAHARNAKAGARAAALKRHHFGWGWSERGLYKLWLAFRNGGHKPGDWRKLGPTYAPGDWRVLLRDYKAGTPAALPEQTKRWLGEQLAQFRGRRDVVNALWRHVVYEVWLQDKPVPGFGTCSEWCLATGRARPHPKLVRPGDLPEGFSVQTFRRALPKRQVTRKQLAHGYLAAHHAQPDQVLTDRSRLMPLMRVVLDDWRYDRRVLWEQGSRAQVVYPLLVLGYDAACAVDLASCLKPRGVKAPEAESEAERKVRHGVTQDMALTIVVEVLRRFGLPPWPITFVHENAAACIPAEAKRLLTDIYGDRIQFEATSVFRERMSAHGFTEAGGCPWSAGKAALESFWRLLAVQSAHLPGATGARYIDNHAELAAMEQYALKLHERAKDLPEVLAALREPLVNFDRAYADIARVLELLRFRTDHALQGFERRKWWRLSPAQPWQPWEKFLTLSPAEQDAAEIINPLESPAERFTRLMAGVKLDPVDHDLLDFLVGEKFPARVRDGKITIDRTALSNVPLVFREDGHPLLEEEHEGRQFTCALTPGADRIVLTRDGRILGSVAQQGRVNAADRDALHREIGRVRSARVADRELLAGYYLADRDEALAALRAHNERVLSTPALADAAPSRAKTKRLPDAADILDSLPER